MENVDWVMVARSGAKALPFLVLAGALVLKRLGVDVDKGERLAAHAFADEFRAKKRIEPETLIGVRESKTIGTPVSAHLVLIALFAAGAVASQVLLSPDALGRVFLAAITLSPVAIAIWSLSSIERVTVGRDSLSWGSWKHGRRSVRYEDVLSAVLVVRRVDHKGLDEATYGLVLEGSEERLELLGLSNKDCLLVGSLFSSRLRRVESDFERSELEPAARS